MKPGSTHSRHASVQRHFVPLHAIRHQTIILTSHQKESTRRYSAILEVGATNYSLKSREEQLVMVAGYKALLRALLFPLQILVCSGRMDLSSYVASLSEVALAPEWEQLIHAHQQDIERLAATRTLIDRRFYLIVDAEEPTSLAGMGRLLLSRRRKQQFEEDALRSAEQVLVSRTASLVTGLAGMGLSARRLSGVELAEVHYRSLRGSDVAIQFPLSSSLYEAISRVPRASRPYWSPSSRLNRNEERKEQEDTQAKESAEEEIASKLQDRLSMVEGLPLADVLAPEAIMIEPDVLRVGEEYVRGIAVVGYPREVVEGWLSPLLQLDEIFDHSFHLLPQENGAVLRQLTLRKAQYTSTQRINAKQGRMHDPMLTVAEGDIEELIGEIASGEERLIETSWYLLVRARSRELLSLGVDRVKNILHAMLLSAHPTTLEHDDAYRSCQPLRRDLLRRSVPLTASVVSTMFPFISDSLVMKDGIFLGVTPSGEPILLNPWELENPHEFWGGISGAGKSYAIKLRMVHELERDRRLQDIVIDPSREYLRMTEEVRGQVIRLAPGSPHTLNPFDLMPKGSNLAAYAARASGDPLADKVQKLHALFDLMLGEHVPVPTALSAKEKSYLDRALYETYRKVGITSDVRTHDRPAPLMRDLYEVLRSGRDLPDVGEDIYGLADRLQRYVKGSLSGLFSRSTNVTLDHRLICFDIRDMSGSPELRPIGIFLIAEFVWTQAMTNPMPRRLYIDEAWSLIEHEHGARFVEKLAREARKYYLSLVTITQNPEHFIASARGSVIAQNAFTKVLKRLDSVGSKAAREAFGLTEEEERLLLSLPQHQALVIVGTRRFVIEISANAVEHDLMTTRPDELTQQGAWEERRETETPDLLIASSVERERRRESAHSTPLHQKGKES